MNIMTKIDDHGGLFFVFPCALVRRSAEVYEGGGRFVVLTVSCACFRWLRSVGVGPKDPQSWAGSITHHPGHFEAVSVPIS